MTRQIVKRGDVTPDKNSKRSLWRLLYPADSEYDHGAVAGIAEYHHHAEGLPEGPAHAAAEFYYVVEGKGVVRLDGTDHEIERGDSFIIPADIPHSLWSTEPHSLVTFYVALTDS
jgi:mannose-6-phosphate isomerase-like protein (cupin superfamily)